MKKFVRFFSLVVIFVVFVSVSSYQLFEAGFFDVQNMNVQIHGELGSDNLLRFYRETLNLNLNKYTGAKLWQIQLDKILEELRAFKWIDTVVVSRSLPNSLNIEIKTKKIISVLMNAKGLYFPVVQDGEILEPVPPSLVPNLPVALGENLEASPELRKKTVAMMKDIPESGKFSLQNISDIRFRESDGFWLTLVKNGIQVKMGEDNFALKSARVAQVLDYVESHSIDARVIDANLTKKVLVRLRKDP